MRPYDLVAFDCYGTLIDWESGMAKALRELARELRLRVEPRSLVRRYIQLELGIEQGGYRRYRDVLRLGLIALFKEKGVALPPRPSRAFARSIPDWEPFPDVAPTLRRLRESGYRTAVLSNVDDRLLRASLERIGVPFDYTVTAESVRSYKPATRHWQKLFALSGAPRRRVLHVAASLVHDIIPAKTLGLPCVWINRRGEKAPAGTTPRHVFSDLRPLGRLLAR